MQQFQSVPIKPPSVDDDEVYFEDLEQALRIQQFFSDSNSDDAESLLDESFHQVPYHSH